MWAKSCILAVVPRGDVVPQLGALPSYGVPDAFPWDIDMFATGFLAWIPGMWPLGGHMSLFFAVHS
eukprot:2986801-Amphidinium_carterae.1